MKDYIDENEKSQDQSEKNIKNFKDFISQISRCTHSNYKLLECVKDFFLNEKLIFIPQSYSLKENGEINKRPLIRWGEVESNSEELEKAKQRLVQVIEEYKNEKYEHGFALKADNYNVFIIDIDDKETFEKNVSGIYEFLNDVKKDAYLINKSLKRGYHVYVNAELVKDIIKLEPNNKELLKTYGFEFKGKGLIVFPPSRFEVNGTLYQSKIMYVNPENFEKAEIESDALKKIIKLVKDYHEEKERLKLLERQAREHREKFKSERKEFSDLSEIIHEVKRSVSFEDLISEKLAKRGSRYDTYHCPFHPPDKNPSFAVYHDGEYDFGYDFHDNKGYDIISFYQETKCCDFLEALENLCDIAGIKFSRQDYLKKRYTKVVVSEEDKPFETTKAIYTKMVSLEVKKKKYVITRVAIFKKEREIWEVTETIKNHVVDPMEYVKDKQDPTFEIIPLDPGINIEEELKKGKTVSYRVIVPNKKIANFTIQKGIKYIDPLGGTPKYDLIIIPAGNGLKCEICEAAFEDILAKVKNDGLVVNSRKVKDDLSQLFLDLITLNKIIQKRMSPQTGFYFDKETGDIIFSRIERKELEIEKLKDALLFLNEVINEYYSHIREKFVTVLKWFITAPFAFLAKQRDMYPKGLYIFGFSGTGKSSMVRLLGKVWLTYIPEKDVLEKGATSIDTVPRLGRMLSQSTFPLIVSEPHGVFNKEEIKEMIKNAMTNTVARGRYYYGQFIEIPALSNIVFTSNVNLPEDDAILRRFVVITLSVKERPGKMKNFVSVESIAKEKLPVIGESIVACFDEIKEKILSLNEENQFQVAKEILELLYKKAGLNIPEWIEDLHEDEVSTEDFNEEQRFFILAKIREVINREFSRDWESRNTIGADFEENLKAFIKKGNIPFAFILKGRDGVERIYFSKKVLEALDINIPDLKSFADTIGWEYGRVTTRISGKKTTLSTAFTTFKNFMEIMVDMVQPDEEDKEEIQSEIDTKLISQDILQLDESLTEGKKN